MASDRRAIGGVAVALNLALIGNVIALVAGDHRSGPIFTLRIVITVALFVIATVLLFYFVRMKRS